MGKWYIRIMYTPHSKETRLFVWWSSSCLLKNPKDYRPQIRFLHLSLFAAILLSSVQVRFSLSISVSSSLRQVCAGLPLFLFPWGFQWRARLVTWSWGLLRVCPSHPHFLFLITSATGSCSVRHLYAWLLFC